MTSRNTAIIAAITLLLGIYVIAVERNRDPNSGRNFSAIPFDKEEDIQNLEITSASGSIRLERGTTSWQMLTPVKDRADSGKVDELVKTLIGMKRREELDGDNAPSDAEMGLDANALKITIEGKDGTKGTLHLGSDAGVEGAIYARWEDGAPFACWRDALDLAEASAESLRDIRLLGVPVELMRRVKFKDRADSSLIIDRATKESPWMITKPLKTPANKTAVDQRLALVANMAAQGFIDNPNGDVAAAFASGTKSVSVRRLGESGVVDLEMAVSPDGSQGFARASDRDAVFRIDPGFLAVVNLDPNVLRDRKLISFNPKSVVGIDIQAKTGPDRPPLNTKLKLDATGWQLVQDNIALPANRQRIYDVLKNLAKEEVEQFVADAVVDLTPYGLDAPNLTVTLSIIRQDPENPVNADGTANTIVEPLELQVRSLQNPNQPVNNYFATIKGSGSVFQLAPTFPSVIPVKSTDYRSLYLWPSFQLASLSRLSMQNAGEAQLDLTYLAATNDWTGKLAGNDVTNRIDRLAALRLAQQLSVPLRATRWLSNAGPEAENALKKPIKKISFELVDPKGKTYPFAIEIAPIKRDGPNALYYARVDGSASICIIDRDTFGVLDGKLLNE